MERSTFDETQDDLKTSTLGHILIVDDEPSILRSLSKTFQFTHPDYRITAVGSAEEALEILGQHTVNLLLSDLKLPKMNGLALTARVRELFPTVPSILMTAFGSERVLRDATENGCMAYLEKPFNLDLLLQSVNLALSAEQRRSNSALTAVEILELYARSKRDVVISVCADGMSGSVVIKNGFIRHASLGKRDGLDALLLILHSASPQFTLLEHGTPTVQTLNLSPQSIRSLLALRKQVAGVLDKCRERGGQLRKKRDELLIGANDTRSLYMPGLEQRRKDQVQELIESGLKFLRANQLEQAKRCWLKALEIDPYSAEAARNLTALKRMADRQKPKT